MWEDTGLPVSPHHQTRLTGVPHLCGRLIPHLLLETNAEGCFVREAPKTRMALEGPGVEP